MNSILDLLAFSVERNSTYLTEKTLLIKRKKTLSRLDEVNLNDVLAVACAFKAGATTEEAYSAGNAVLIAAGRDPIPVSVFPEVG